MRTLALVGSSRGTHQGGNEMGKKQFRRTFMWSHLRRLAVTGSVLGVALATSAAMAASTVPLNVTMRANWNPASTCPPGVPRKVGGSFSPCFVVRARNTFPGLGKVTVRQSVGFLNSSTKCMTIKSKIVLAIGTNGEVHADGKTTRCVDPQGDVTVVPFKITGGTGAYTTATGSGTITVTEARETGRGYGDQKETWKGTLTFAG